MAGWFAKEVLELKSPAAPEAVIALGCLDSRIECPSVLSALPRRFFGGAETSDQAPAGIISAKAERLYTSVLRRGVGDREARIARLPRTKEEVKAHLKRRRKEFDQRLLSLLAREGSTASRIH